jgi:hypothetical protein
MADLGCGSQLDTTQWPLLLRDNHNQTPSKLRLRNLCAMQATAALAVAREQLKAATALEAEVAAAFERLGGMEGRAAEAEAEAHTLRGQVRVGGTVGACWPAHSSRAGADCKQGQRPRSPV